MTAMAKVRLLAVLTMDGCPAETTGLSGRWLGSDQYGIGALKEAATCILTEDTSLTLLSNRMENTGDSLNYLIEATEKTAGIINGMIRMRLVDEIILYMVPVIAGNGSRLFQSSLPESEWTCTGSRQWKDGMVRIAYGRNPPPPTGGDVRKMNARDVQKVNVRSDSEQKKRRREKLQKIFSANISLNISVIYPYLKKNTPAGPLFVP